MGEARPVQEMAYLQSVLERGSSVVFERTPSGKIEVTLLDEVGIYDVAEDLTPARALKKLRLNATARISDDED